MMFKLGAFELVEEIGQGAASRVWSAIHVRSRRKIALKIFNELSGRKATDHLFREIRLVARASHPHIVRIFGYGQTQKIVTLPTGDVLPKDHLYLVMELAQKGTLKSVLGRVTWEESRSVLMDILGGLARVHARGIVHLDLKPVNVLLTERGAVVSDFGIAVGQQLSTKDSAHDKKKGTVGKLALVGTPQFMAPEQCVSAHAFYGPWTDLYAVGCIAHTLITGRPPYREKEVVDVLIAHRTADIPQLEDRYRVPVGFDAWFQKLLAKRWQDRFLWAEDARMALSRLGSPANQNRVHPSLSSWSEPTLLSNEQLSDDTMLDMVMLRGEVPTGVIPLVAEQPDVPKEWHEEVSDVADDGPLEGVGIELNQFETARIVGRHDERRQLWRQFARSARRNKITMTVIRGAPGTGKSALAEWLCSAAHEQGVAHYLQARHSRDASAQDGILGALKGFFAVGDDAEVSQTVSERLGLSEDDLLCSAVMNLIQRAYGRGVDAPELLRHQERDHLLCRLLEHLSQLRTLILYLDDAQWGFDSLRLANTLLELNPRTRVHVLITVNTEELQHDSMAAQQLAQCGQSKATEMLELGPMSPEDCALLVESRAQLTPTAVEELVATSKGNPLFVREFLLSRLTEDVRRRRTGTTSMKKLWKIRIEQWLPVAPIGAALALQAAAVLGSRLNLMEWRALLPSSEHIAIDDVFSSALEVGFLNHELDGDITFAHGLLRDSLLELSREDGHFHDLHRAAGDMLVLGKSTDFVRLAKHFQNAMVLDTASDYWEKAVADFRNRDDYSLLRWALTQFTRVQRARRIPHKHPEWWRVIWYWSHVDRTQDRVHKSLRRLRRLKAMVMAHNPDDPILVEILNDIANCRSRLEGPGTVMDVLDEAAALAQRVAPEMYVDMLVAKAKDRKFTGKFTEAEVLYREALEKLGPGESRLLLRVGSHIRLGDCLSRRQSFGEAIEEVEKGLRLARKSISPNLLGESLNLYGEVLRASGNLDGAEKAYREATDILSSCGSSTQYIAHANLALVLQLRGAFKSSRRIIEDLLRARSQLDYPRERMVFTAVLLPCLVDAEEWVDVDTTLNRLEETLTVEWAEFDIAEGALRASDMLILCGENYRAVRSLRVAADQFCKLDRDEDLKTTQAKIAALVD